jgi:hypothetical protein
MELPTPVDGAWTIACVSALILKMQNPIDGVISTIRTFHVRIAFRMVV